jgi:hypothetical protein
MPRLKAMTYYPDGAILFANALDVRKRKRAHGPLRRVRLPFKRND